MMVVFDLVLYPTSRHLLIAWNGLSEHYSNLFAQMLNRQNLLLAGVLYYYYCEYWSNKMQSRLFEKLSSTRTRLL